MAATFYAALVMLSAWQDVAASAYVYDITVEILQVKLAENYASLDSGDNLPDIVVRLEAMQHEQFTSQKGGTLFADWTQDVGGQRRTFCEWEAGSEMTIQILDNDAEYEDLVYGSSSRNFDVAAEGTVPAEYLDLTQDEVKQEGWCFDQICVIAKFSRWDANAPPKCGNWWGVRLGWSELLEVNFLRAEGPDRDRRLDSHGDARRLDSDWVCKGRWEDTERGQGTQTSTLRAPGDDNSPENFGSLAFYPFNYGYIAGSRIEVECYDEDTIVETAFGNIGEHDNFGTATITPDDIYYGVNHPDTSLFLRLSENSYIYVSFRLTT